MPKLMKVPEATIKRLSVYMRVLKDMEKSGIEVVSSAELADVCGVNAAQIRKDLTYFGEFGVRGVGYYVKELFFDIRRVLGLNEKRNVVLIGYGYLGHALISYKNFTEHGYNFVAAFDVTESKIEELLPNNIPILHLDELPRVAQEQDIEMAILTTPAKCAQAVADKIIAAGIKGILNFAPVKLKIPEGVKVKRVDLTTEFDNLIYNLYARSH